MAKPADGDPARGPAAAATANAPPGRDRRFAVAMGLVFALALAVRCTYWAQVAGTPLDRWHEWAETDMATFVEQARRFAAGDWWAKAPYHPFHSWQTASGTEAEWLSWYGAHGFHQAPLYSYLLAIGSLLTASHLALAKLCQLVLGAATGIVLGLVATRLGGRVAGVAAALLIALYGPLYYLECQVLREGPALFGIALVLWLLVQSVERPRRWQVPALGVLLGVFAMFHELGPVLAAAVAVVVAVHAHGRQRRGYRRAAAATAVFALGWLLGFLPLLTRNLVVGAPPLAVSSRPHLTLALCNRPDAPDGGALFLAPGPEFNSFMDAAGNTTLGVACELWRRYEGDRLAMLGNWLHRLRAVFATVEVPDNTSFDFHRHVVPVLATSTTFGLVFPLGAAAFAVLLVTLLVAHRRARGTPLVAAPGSLLQAAIQKARVHGALLFVFAMLLLAATMVNSQARYRLVLVPVLACYAGLFVALLWQQWTTRRLGNVALLLLATALASMLQHVWSTPWAPLRPRPIDSIIVAERYMRDRDEAGALPFFRMAHELQPDDVAAHVAYASSLARLSLYRDALAEFEAIDRVAPGAFDVPQKIQSLRQLLAAPPQGPPIQHR